MIKLITYEGSEVTSKDDAMITDLLSSEACGLLRGCEVTSLGANQLHISAGYGVIRGRAFKVEEETILAELTASGNKRGRLWIHMDIADGSVPIKFMTTADDVLPALVQDADVNFTAGVWEMALAEYDVNETAISNMEVLARTYAAPAALTADNGQLFQFAYDGNEYGHKVGNAFMSFGANMRYNEETDMVQIKYNDSWVDWESANLQALKLYTTGVMNVPIISSEVAATGMTNQNTVVFDVASISIPAASKGKYNGIITNDKINLSGRSQLIAEIEVDGVASTQIMNISTVDAAYIALYSFYSTGATAHDFRFRAVDNRNLYNNTGTNLLAQGTIPTGSVLKIKKLYAK